MSRVKRTSGKKYYCLVHKEAFDGYQWGGHRRVCQEKFREIKLKPPTPPTPPLPPGEGAKIANLVKTTAADQVVKTVRSYLSGIEEERTRVTARLNELGMEMEKLRHRQNELDEERSKIVSSFKDLK